METTPVVEAQPASKQANTKTQSFMDGSFSGWVRYRLARRREQNTKDSLVCRQRNTQIILAFRGEECLCSPRD